MGFLDKAKAAANDLAAKADTALGSSGMGGPKAPGSSEADTYFRDLGVLAYLEANGCPADPDQHLRVVTVLQEMDTRGAIPSFALHTAPPPPTRDGRRGKPERVPPTARSSGFTGASTAGRDSTTAARSCGLCNYPAPAAAVVDEQGRERQGLTGFLLGPDRGSKPALANRLAWSASGK